jgi:hypothetical protein
LPQGVYDPDIPEHTAKKTVPETVLKLTQVGEMSILRRSRERS